MPELNRLEPLLVVREAARAVDFYVRAFGVHVVARRDPFGHLWLISQRLEALTPDEIERRRDAFANEAAKTGRT